MTVHDVLLCRLLERHKLPQIGFEHTGLNSEVGNSG